MSKLNITTFSDPSLKMEDQIRTEIYQDVSATYIDPVSLDTKPTFDDKGQAVLVVSEVSSGAFYTRDQGESLLDFCTRVAAGINAGTGYNITGASIQGLMTEQGSRA